MLATLTYRPDRNQGNCHDSDIIIRGGLQEWAYYRWWS